MSSTQDLENTIRALKERLEKVEKSSLSPEKLKEIDALIEYKNHTNWFWSSLRTWILAISSAIALLTIGLDGVKTILKRFILG